MTNPARVTAVDTDGMVRARYIKPISAKGATSRSFWNVKERSFPVKNSSGLPVAEGDFIAVSVQTGLTIGAAFLVFMVPLILFASAYGLGGFLFETEGLRVLTGLVGLAAGLVLPAGINLLKKEKNYPELEKILTLEGLQEFMSCSDCAACDGCG